MACNPDFVQYVADQCAGAGEIVTKKMFGGYCIYCNGKIFGLICNDGLYIKPTQPGRALLRTEEMRPPYPGAKDYFYIADVLLTRVRARVSCYNAKKSFTSFTDGVIGLIISEMWVKDFFLSILHPFLCVSAFDRVVKDFCLFYISLQVLDF